MCTAHTPVSYTHLLRFAVSATGGAHLCSIQYYLRFWLSSCRTSVSYTHLDVYKRQVFIHSNNVFGTGNLQHLDDGRTGSAGAVLHDLDVYKRQW